MDTGHGQQKDHRLSSANKHIKGKNDEIVSMELHIPVTTLANIMK